jgi:hypothetical protein
MLVEKLNRFLDNFRDILGYQRFTVLQGQPAFLEVGNAVWTSSCQHLSPSLNSQRDSEIGEALALHCFHPYPAAATAAAVLAGTQYPAINACKFQDNDSSICF